MSKERLEKLRNGTTFSSEDIDWIMERAMLYEISRDSFIVVDKENEQLRAENKRYREALEFYAKRGHYIASGYPNTELQAIEYGEIARKSLEESK